MDKIRTNNGSHVYVETMKDIASIETLYDNTGPSQASAGDFDYNMDMKVEQNYINRKEYLCCHCNKYFDLNGIIEEHTRIQTVNVTYQCSFCCKHFACKRNSTLGKPLSYIAQGGKHLITHIQDKPFKCIQCCRDLAQITMLVQRQICTQKNNLVKNMNTCPEKKKYQCNQCG
ncbi:unnamed protein product, partial [Meganyctiphanes norvegica]